VAAAAAREELKQLNPDLLNKASGGPSAAGEPGPESEGEEDEEGEEGRGRGRGLGGGYLVGFRVYSSAFGVVERTLRLGRVIYNTWSILDRSENRAPGRMFPFVRSASFTLL
jgi:hypothetical protein